MTPSIGKDSEKHVVLCQIRKNQTPILAVSLFGSFKNPDALRENTGLLWIQTSCGENSFLRFSANSLIEILIARKSAVISTPVEGSEWGKFITALAQSYRGLISHENLCRESSTDFQWDLIWQRSPGTYYKSIWNANCPWGMLLQTSVISKIVDGSAGFFHQPTRPPQPFSLTGSRVRFETEINNIWN